jgi:hypothetical protein
VESRRLQARHAGLAGQDALHSAIGGRGGNREDAQAEVRRILHALLKHRFKIRSNGGAVRIG